MAEYALKFGCSIVTNDNWTWRSNFEKTKKVNSVEEWEVIYKQRVYKMDGNREIQLYILQNRQINFVVESD